MTWLELFLFGMPWEVAAIGAAALLGLAIFAWLSEALTRDSQ